MFFLKSFLNFVKTFQKLVDMYDAEATYNVIIETIVKQFQTFI